MVRVRARARVRVRVRVRVGVRVRVRVLRLHRCLALAQRRRAVGGRAAAVHHAPLLGHVADRGARLRVGPLGEAREVLPRRVSRK